MIVQEDAGGDNGAVAIFYLDNPGPIGSGTIEVSASNPNGGIGTALALSGTAAGYGASSTATGSAVTSVSLTTEGDNSAQRRASMQSTRTTTVRWTSLTPSSCSMLCSAAVRSRQHHSMHAASIRLRILKTRLTTRRVRRPYPPFRASMNVTGGVRFPSRS